MIRKPLIQELGESEAWQEPTVEEILHLLVMETSYEEVSYVLQEVINKEEDANTIR